MKLNSLNNLLGNVLEASGESCELTSGSWRVYNEGVEERKKPPPQKKKKRKKSLGSKRNVIYRG